MGEIVLTCINAILPIILLILLGYFLKRIKILNGNFLKVGNGLDDAYSRQIFLYDRV